MFHITTLLQQSERSTLLRSPTAIPPTRRRHSNSRHPLQGCSPLFRPLIVTRQRCVRERSDAAANGTDPTPAKNDTEQQPVLVHVNVEHAEVLPFQTYVRCPKLVVPHVLAVICPPIPPVTL